ncbi:MAG: hypothetical protein AB4080_17330 [Trichodesmium sp.]
MSNDCNFLSGNLVNMPSNDRENQIQVNFKLSCDKWQRFQLKCEERDASTSEVLNLLVDLYLEEKIDSHHSILSVDAESEINAKIGKYIGNKLDRYIDKYIEKKLIQAIDKIDEVEDSVTIKNNQELNNSKIVKNQHKDQDEGSLMTEVIEIKESEKTQFNQEYQEKELKTARELAEFFGCSPAYITTLNRLGDLEKRGWKDSGKKQGKAILYQQINIRD